MRMFAGKESTEGMMIILEKESAEGMMMIMEKEGIIEGMMMIVEKEGTEGSRKSRKIKVIRGIAMRITLRKLNTMFLVQGRGMKVKYCSP
jgi:hypothetical protein